MIITDTLIIQKAIEEIENKTFGYTNQFLNVHELVYVDNKPVISRVDREQKDGTAIVYFPVKDQRFYFIMYLNTQPEISVRAVERESGNSVYFVASSEILDFTQLSELTTLTPTRGRNKGDKRGGTFWKNSIIIFEPNSEPDEVEDKLKKLLDFLEQDKLGIKKLVDNAEGYIQVIMEFYVHNTMLGGVTLNKEDLRRIVDLNLQIDFDLHASGKPFK
jgi:hypothetical protein